MACLCLFNTILEHEIRSNDFNHYQYFFNFFTENTQPCHDHGGECSIPAMVAAKIYRERERHPLMSYVTQGLPPEVKDRHYLSPLNQVVTQSHWMNHSESPVEDIACSAKLRLRRGTGHSSTDVKLAEHFRVKEHH
jgi:hypothetical protein